MSNIDLLLNVSMAGWAGLKIAFERYPDNKCFSYRPFEEPLKDPFKVEQHLVCEQFVTSQGHKINRSIFLDIV